jgi:maltose alpha-D-glucosyltransferase / alpha-amylase
MPRTEPTTLAVLHRFVPHVSTAWAITRQELGRYYDRVLARNPSEGCPPPPTESPLLLAGREPPPQVTQMVGSYRDTAAQLGECIAEVHLRLAASGGDAAFAPEPYTALDRRSKYQSLRNLSGTVMRMLQELSASLPERARREAGSILTREGDLVKSFAPLLQTKTSALRIRAHGNPHLGRFLNTGKNFVMVDFGGLPELTLAERRRKRSPLRDLAWMVLSFEYAAFSFLLDPARVRESDVDTAQPWAQHWTSWASASFINAYLSATAGARFVPAERDQTALLFDAFLLERTLYQLRIELRQPSQAVMIPLLGIGHLLARGGQPPVHTV